MPLLAETPTNKDECLQRVHQAIGLNPDIPFSRISANTFIENFSQQLLARLPDTFSINPHLITLRALGNQFWTTAEYRQVLSDSLNALMSELQAENDEAGFQAVAETIHELTLVPMQKTVQYREDLNEFRQLDPSQQKQMQQNGEASLQQ